MQWIKLVRNGFQKKITIQRESTDRHQQSAQYQSPESIAETQEQAAVK